MTDSPTPGGPASSGPSDRGPDEPAAAQDVPVRRTCYRHTDRYAPVRCQRCDQSICPDCMVPAAVGFQCPACVAAGRKATRTGRTVFGGEVARDATRTSLVLIALNAVVWLAVTASGGGASRLVDLLGLRASGLCTDGFSGYPNASRAVCESSPGLTWLPGFTDGAVWQVVTSLFTHVDVLHIAFNMVALYFIAPQLEQLLGRARLLALYLLSGLAGSLVVLWFGPGYASTIGASGSIFGLLGALLVISVKRRLPLNGLLFWLGLNVVITVVGSNISWEAHLGGFVGGVAVTAVLAYAPRARRTLLQVVGLAGIGLVLVAGMAARVLVG